MKEALEKLKSEMETVFINLMYLSNECRETEAREQIISILKAKIKLKKQLISDMNQACDNITKAKQTLKPIT